MARPDAALRATRIALAVACAGFGIFLLVRAWFAPVDGSAATFMPVAFIGAMVSFGVSVVLVARPPQPRSGRPAAR